MNGGPSSEEPGWCWALARILLFVGLLLTASVALEWALPDGLVGQGAAIFVAATAVGWLLLRKDGAPPGALGLPVDRETARELLSGLALGVGVAGLALGLIALAGGVRWVREPGSAGAWLGGGAAWMARLALPAAAEEVALRGYLFQVVARAWSPAAALVGTSVVFALLHLGNPGVGWAGLVGITAAGLLLGALVLRSRALWWAVGAHLGWNWTLAWPADLVVSGLDLADTPGLDARISGPAWLSGGAFGPEASALASLALVVVAWAVWRARWIAPRPGRPAPLYAARERRGA